MLVLSTLTSYVRTSFRHVDLRIRSICSFVNHLIPSLVHIDTASTALSSRRLLPRRLPYCLRHPSPRGAGKGERLRAYRLVRYIRRLLGPNPISPISLAKTVRIAIWVQNTKTDSNRHNHWKCIKGNTPSRRPHENTLQRSDPKVETTSVVSSGESCVDACSFI
jgi:hypothetical protein